MAACRCPTAASPRSSSTSARSSASARWRARTAWQARCSTARPRCPTSCSTTSPRSRRPRSTSPPASRTRSTTTRRSRRDLLERDRGVVLRQHRRRAQARRDRRAVHLQDAQEGARPVQAPAVGAADQGRDPGRPAEEAALPVRPAEGIGHDANTSRKYVDCVERHQPLPECDGPSRRSQGLIRSTPDKLVSTHLVTQKGVISRGRRASHLRPRASLDWSSRF